MGITMKLSMLKRHLKEYDRRKGLGRRLFGDALQIKVLKELIRVLEVSSSSYEDIYNQEITLQLYRNFATRKGYRVDLSDSYLNSNSASATIFKLWKNEETRARLIVGRVTLFPAEISNLDIFQFIAILAVLNGEVPSVHVTSLNRNPTMFFYHSELPTISPPTDNNSPSAAPAA